MATFSVNQARHLFVVTGTVSDKTELKNAGQIAASATPEGEIPVMSLTYMGAKKNLISTDKLTADSIISITPNSKLTPAKRKLQAVKVSLDADINGGAPIVGQDYILRIIVRQYISGSDDSQTVKYGMVHVTSAIKDAATFYTKLAESLEKNFSREPYPLFTFKAESDGVVITEVEQDWSLGKMTSAPISFEVMPTTVVFEGEEAVWGKVAKVDSGVEIPNGKQIADLEWFCMGERGDIYRGVGYPHNIDTKYLVDETQHYSILDIHYAYSGSNEAVQKSEKILTFVSTDASALETLATNFRQLLGE